MNIRFGEVYRLQYQRRDLRHSDIQTGKPGSIKTLVNARDYINAVGSSGSDKRSLSLVHQSFYSQCRSLTEKLEKLLSKASFPGLVTMCHPISLKGANYLITNGITNSLTHYEKAFDKFAPNRHASKEAFHEAWIFARPRVEDLLESQGFFQAAEPLTVQYSVSKTGRVHLTNGNEVIAQIKQHSATN